MCWVRNTYYIDDNSEIPDSPDIRLDSSIRYYQWIPFILMFQAFFFFLPYLFWRLLSQRSGKMPIWHVADLCWVPSSSVCSRRYRCPGYRGGGQQLQESERRETAWSSDEIHRIGDRSVRGRSTSTIRQPRHSLVEEMFASLFSIRGSLHGGLPTKSLSLHKSLLLSQCGRSNRPTLGIAWSTLLFAWDHCDSTAVRRQRLGFHQSVFP